MICPDLNKDANNLTVVTVIFLRQLGRYTWLVYLVNTICLVICAYNQTLQSNLQSIFVENINVSIDIAIDEW